MSQRQIAELITTEEATMVHTALVTGGNRGIGLEICRQLAREGHAIVLGSRDSASGEEAAADLRSAGHDVRVVAIDVSDDNSVRVCASDLAGAGVHIDVLVNNAGVLAEGDLLSGSSAPMNEAVAVNFLGPYRTACAFMPDMARRGWGRVVNVSSGWGSFASGLEGPAAYAVSKAALNALTVRLAREAGPGGPGQLHVPGLGSHPDGRRNSDALGCARRRHRALPCDAARRRTDRRILPRPDARAVVALRTTRSWAMQSGRP